MTRLEAMRAARDERERPQREEIERLTIEAVRARGELRATREELQATRENVDRLGRVITSDIGKHIIENLHHQAARDMQPKLYEILAGKADEVATIKLSRRDLQFLRPSEAQQRVLDMVEHHMTKAARVSVSARMANYATVITITVPQFQISQAIHNEMLEPRRAYAVSRPQEKTP